jgi:transposase
MRYELTDFEWSAIRLMLPNKSRGVPRVDDRRVLNGIFWVLRSGAPWRDLPGSFGPYTTCYNRFVRWRRAGIWDRIMDSLTSAHDAAVQMIDTSIVRVHQHGGCICRQQKTIDGQVARWTHEQNSCRRRCNGVARPPCPDYGGSARQSTVFGIVEWVEAWDNVASGSWIRCRLDQDICPGAWRVGQHSAKTEPQGAYLLQPSPLPRS